MQLFTETKFCAFYLDQKNIYLGKQYFLSSGYGFPLTKGSLLRSHVDKWYKTI